MRDTRSISTVYGAGHFNQSMFKIFFARSLNIHGITHPEFRGLTGRKRIKQRFKATGTLPKPFFPPKWGINERVEEWISAQGSGGRKGPETFKLI